MAPKELIVNLTKHRMSKLPEYGANVPVKIKGAGNSGEFHVNIPNPVYTQGSGIRLAGEGVNLAGGKTNWLNVSKKAAAVASPMVMMGGPEMAPVAAGLGVYAGSGKKKSKARKTKQTVGTAAQIAAILAASQGYDKEASAISQVGKVVGGKKSKAKKKKQTAGDIAQIMALLGQSSGYIDPNQAAALSATGNLISGMGLPLSGDMYDPPQAHLPPRRASKPKVAVSGGAYSGGVKKKPRFAVA